MSTRANIVIKDKHGQMIFYRHSDGYPEGTLPTLKKFMSWVKSGKIRDNVSQAAGWLIMVGAQEYDSVYVGAGKSRKKTTLTEPGKDDIMSGWKVGAYEPTTAIHGDIDYLYTLDLTAKTITVEEMNGGGILDTITTFEGEPEVSEPLESAPVEQPSRFEGIV
jgi:hypothetical protein